LHETVLLVGYPWIVQLFSLERAQALKASNGHPSEAAANYGEVFRKHGRSETTTLARSLGQEMANLNFCSRKLTPRYEVN
jgi:hypothetical protein